MEGKKIILQTMDEVEPIDVVELSLSDSHKLEKLNTLYYSKWEDSFFYKYKFGGLTFKIELIGDMFDGFLVDRTTEEYFYAFVKDSGPNVSAMTLKKMVKSIDKYFLERGEDRRVRKLMFDRVYIAYTQEDFDNLRSFLKQNIPDLPASRIDKMSFTELVKIFRAGVSRGTFYDEEIQQRIDEVERSDTRDLAHKKRARASNIGLLNAFKEEIRRGEVTFQKIGNALVIHFNKDYVS